MPDAGAGEEADEDRCCDEGGIIAVEFEVDVVFVVGHVCG